MGELFRSKPTYLREKTKTPVVPTAQTEPEPTAATSGGSGVGGIAGFATGIAKGLAKTAKNQLLGQDIDVFGQKVEMPSAFARGPLGSLATRAIRNAPIMERVDEALQPKTGAEKAGYTVEQIGEFFVPGMAGVRGQTALKLARESRLVQGLPRIAQKVVPRLAQMGTEGLSTLAVTTQQRGEIGKEGLREAAFSAATAPFGKIPQAIFGGTQVGQGVKQIAEGDISSGATNVGVGLAQIWSASKTKGWLLDEPVSMVIKGDVPQVSGEPAGPKVPQQPELPTLRQKLGERISKASLKFTKSDIDAGADVRTGAIYDVQRSSLGDTLDETQKRIAGYNNVVKEVVQKSGDPMVVDLQKALKNVRSKFTAQGSSLNIPKYEQLLGEIENSFNQFIPDRQERKLSVSEGLKTRREFGKQAVFHHDPLNKGDNALKEELFNALYMEMKKELDTNLPPQFKGANEALSKLIPYQNAILRRLPIEERQNILGITDNMTAIAGLFDPKALALGMVNRSLRNPAVGRMLMQSGPLDRPFQPSEIPQAPQYPRLMAPGQSTYRPPDVIALPGRGIPDTTPSALYQQPTAPKPKTIEELRFEALQEAAEKNRNAPIMSRMANYQDAEMRVMEQDLPRQGIEPPNMLSPRQIDDAPRMTAKDEAQMRRSEVSALQEQLQAFSYAVPEMEDGYRAFKQLADRSKGALDDIMDADAFVKKYGRDKANTIIEGAVRGGDMTNNELLDAYRMRYRTEQSVKAQIERMKKGQPQVLTPEDIAVFAMAPLGGVQIEYDEKGNPRYTFNTEQSLGSLALGAGIIAGKKAFKKPPKIDIPTQKEMIEVIDYARLKPGSNQKLEEQAGMLAEKYGIKAKTIGQVANAFSAILDKIKATKGYPSALDPKYSDAYKSKPTQNASDGILYHGTATEFTEFDPTKFRGGNQGDGVYLTTSKDIANYHSYSAKDNVLDKRLGRMPKQSEREAGVVLETSLKPGLKIKELNKMPNQRDVEAYKKEGYDAVVFPDEVVREDWNTALQGPYPKNGTAKTTLVFNPANVVVNKNTPK